MIEDNESYSYCPIQDSEKCRYFSVDRREGVNFWWTPDDYYNFAKAFFRYKELVEKFMRQEELMTEQEFKVFKEERKKKE